MRLFKLWQCELSDPNHISTFWSTLLNICTWLSDNNLKLILFKKCIVPLVAKSINASVANVLQIFLQFKSFSIVGLFYFFCISLKLKLCYESIELVYEQWLFQCSILLVHFVPVCPWSLICKQLVCVCVCVYISWYFCT